MGMVTHSQVVWSVVVRSVVREIQKMTKIY